MPALGHITASGFIVAYWKYTYRVTLPTGEILWGDSFKELSDVNMRSILGGLMIIFEAGKKAQCNFIKKVLQIEG